MKKLTLEKICEIFFERTNIDFRENSLREQMLFGNCLNIKPRELLMVYMDLKQQYNVCISGSDLLEKKLLTFNSLVDTVEQTCGYSIQ